MGRYKGNNYERFMAKVDQRGPDECWLWQASKTGNGYGQFFLDDAKIVAHRASWILNRGPIPDDLVVMHICDICDGKGGWWICPDAKHHPDDAATPGAGGR